MIIESLLAARLKTVTANVYPNVAPQKYKTPCVVYQRIDTDSVRDVGDDEQTQTFITFQLSISSPVFGDALALARSIKASLKSWEHEKIAAVAWLDEHHEVDQSTDTQLHRVMLFFQFMCDEQ